MNLTYADDIDRLAEGESELASLVSQLDRAFTKSGVEISAKKTKLMSNEYGSVISRHLSPWREIRDSAAV